MAEKREGMENIKKLSELLSGEVAELLAGVKKSENNLRQVKTRLSEKGRFFAAEKAAAEKTEAEAQEIAVDAKETASEIKSETVIEQSAPKAVEAVEVKEPIITKPEMKEIIKEEPKVLEKVIEEVKSQETLVKKEQPILAAEKPAEKSAEKTALKPEIEKPVLAPEVPKSENTAKTEKPIIKADNAPKAEKPPIRTEKPIISGNAPKAEKPIIKAENTPKIEKPIEVAVKTISVGEPKKEETAKEPEVKKEPEKPSWLVRRADKTEEKKPVVRDNSNRSGGYNNYNRNPNYTPRTPLDPNAPRPPRKEYIAADNVRERSGGYQGSNYQSGYQGANNNYRGTNNYQGTNNNYQGTNNNYQGTNNNYQGSRPPFNRTSGTRPPYVSNAAKPTVAPPIIPAQKDTKVFINKKKPTDVKYEEKKTISKRALIKQSVTAEDFDENKTGYRKVRPIKKQKAQEAQQFIKIENAVISSEVIPLKVLSEKIGISAIDITKKLFKEGIMKTINDSIDFETAAYIASDLGINLELKLEKTAEDKLSEGFIEETEDETLMVKRPPVVTVMGHVDHGKTSLLDRIRKTSVTTGEAGGITQHIGAYQVSIGGKPITFLDTPGHAAFTSMRARGAKSTDIAVLVVAADDGIMPQTIEAINHAKAANVPIIVAINKIDKQDANIDRIKTQLTAQGLVPEEWGGDVMLCPVSARTGEGVENLLESIILLADLKDLKANPNRKAKGVVIEAKLDQSKGPIATVLIQAGTLKVGDPIIIGTVVGKVRAMVDDKGRKINSAGLSVPVSVMGLDDVPNAGDTMFVVSAELTKQVSEERKNKAKESDVAVTAKVTLDDVFNKIAEGEIKTLNIIVKADVQGSVEAVKQSLSKMSNGEVKVSVIHAAAGAINETDVMLAESSKAILIGFNVRPDTNAKLAAEHSGVDVRLYRVIYEAIDDVEKALKGMLAPKFQEIYMGKAEVRNAIKITGVGMIAGSYVTEGKIVRNSKLRIYRENIMICEGNVLQLKRFKDDVKEVMQGFECGISIEKFNDIKVGDFIECYLVEQIIV